MTQSDTQISLELCSIDVNEDYLKKWNSTHYKDFKLLCNNGIPLNDTLYRLGGISNMSDLKNDYFLILKYVEAFYEDNITKNKNEKRYLDGRWCIVDKFGNEKVVFTKSIDNPYLKGGLLYVINNKYYNIETGYCYGTAYKSMDSDEYLFIDNSYDTDKSKRGILKINKKTGEYTTYPKK